MKMRVGFITASLVLALVCGSWLVTLVKANPESATAATASGSEAEKPAMIYAGTGAEALAQVDSDFSKMSAAAGAVKAFSTFLADDAVKLAENEKPIIGKSAICAHLEQYDKRRLYLTWRPTKAEVAASGELGYTYGTWKLRTKHRKEVVAVGNYTTVWKKSVGENPTWKAVLDIGNQSRE